MRERRVQICIHLYTIAEHFLLELPNIAVLTIAEYEGYPRCTNGYCCTENMRINYSIILILLTLNQ